MTREAKEGLPQITLQYTTRVHEYTNERKERTENYALIKEPDGTPAPLDGSQFRAISKLGENTPDLVYTSSLLGALTDTPVSGEQYIAELMHRLSQPDLLGDLVKPEAYGTHTVGYRLLAKIKVDHKTNPPFRYPRSIVGRLFGIS
ncbi:hypothetical protein HYU95_03780 [Candidatus Daviesbacteria bacterium]|nr:hypothetical protein [Candidatus Daviesbacteria bacterium]